MGMTQPSLQPLHQGWAAESERDSAELTDVIGATPLSAPAKGSAPGFEADRNFPMEPEWISVDILLLLDRTPIDHPNP